jgi:hypothetical protein
MESQDKGENPMTEVDRKEYEDNNDKIEHQKITKR